LTYRLLAKGIAQLRRSGDELLRARHKRSPHALAILRGAGLGGKLAHRRGDLKQLRSGVLLCRREAVAGGDLLRGTSPLRRKSARDDGTGAMRRSRRCCPQARPQPE
jgi:hypothetical protein